MFWDDYTVPGGTLRENYLGIKGASRLSDTHPGAKRFWKAGEDAPAYARETNGHVKEENGVTAARKRQRIV